MKVIGIDLDDILLNFNDAFIKFHNKTYGTSHSRKDITSFYLEKVWGVSEEEIYKRLDQFYNSDDHKDAEPVEGAIEAIGELAKKHALYVVTASPEAMKKEIGVWLQKHFPDRFKDIHFVNKTLLDPNKRTKGEICQGLGVEIFIDDALHNAENIAKCGIPVLLLDTPWNQGEVSPPIERVYSWSEILQKVQGDKA